MMYANDTDVFYAIPFKNIMMKIAQPVHKRALPALDFKTDHRKKPCR